MGNEGKRARRFETVRYPKWGNEFRGMNPYFAKGVNLLVVERSKFAALPKGEEHYAKLLALEI